MTDGLRTVASNMDLSVSRLTDRPVNRPGHITEEAWAQISSCLSGTPGYHFPEILPSTWSAHVCAVSCVHGEAPYTQETEPWRPEVLVYTLQKSACTSRRAYLLGSLAHRD